MSDLPGETHAIAVALNIARQYGYGNLISRLQAEWSERLQKNSGLSKDAADGGAWKPSWFWGRIDELKARNALLERVADAARYCSNNWCHTNCPCRLCVALKALDAGRDGGGVK